MICFGSLLNYACGELGSNLMLSFVSFNLSGVSSPNPFCL